MADNIAGMMQNYDKEHMRVGLIKYIASEIESLNLTADRCTPVS
jgi:hypothetical protein